MEMDGLVWVADSSTVLILSVITNTSSIGMAWQMCMKHMQRSVLGLSSQHGAGM
jgi:hypothetical protein